MRKSTETITILGEASIDNPAVWHAAKQIRERLGAAECYVECEDFTEVPHSIVADCTRFSLKFSVGV